MKELEKERVRMKGNKGEVRGEENRGRLCERKRG